MKPSFSFLVSLTTIPEKFHAIEEPIDSILRQEDVDVANDVTIVVHLAASYDFRLNGTTVNADALHQMKERYRQYPNVIFQEGLQDVGPGLKLVGIESYIQSQSQQQDDPNKSVIVVLIDDDVGYFSDFLKTVANHLLKNPTMRAGSFYSYTLPFYEMGGQPMQAYGKSEMTVAQGVDGFFMYLDDIMTTSRDFFGYFRHLWNHADRQIFLHDDIYLSYFFFQKGIRLHTIRLTHSNYVYFYTRFAAHRINALQDLGNRAQLNQWMPGHLYAICMMG